MYTLHHKIIGSENQDKLSKTTIAIIGLGGLGCHVAQMLYRTGFHQLIFIDDDVVELGNLPRQILFYKKDIGQAKVVAAKQNLEQFEKGRLQTIPERLTSKNSLEYLKNADLVVDCTDNFTGRYAISKACKALNIPMIYGGVQGFNVQVATFGFQNSLYFHEAFPDEKALLNTEDCSASGVLPHVVALAANYQVNAIIQMIFFGETETNALLAVNLKTGKQRWLRLQRSE